LYNQFYLASNCTLPFIENTTVDDTIGTYVTNYLILGTGLAIALLLTLCQTKPFSSSPPRRVSTRGCGRPIIFYFIFTALGYGLAGVRHQIIHSKSDTLGTKLDPIFYTFVVAGNAFLVASALFPTPTNCNDKFCRNIFTSTVLVASHIAILVLSIHYGETVLGISLLVTVTCMAVYYICHCGKSRWNVLKSFSMVVYAVGLIIQVALRTTCGDGGYRDCFRRCPLPDPSKFNHNALFHVMVLASIVLFGIAESQYPSTLLPPSPTDDESAEKS
jgi:hypothetical protein